MPLRWIGSKFFLRLTLSKERPPARASLFFQRVRTLSAADRAANLAAGSSGFGQHWKDDVLGCARL